MTDQQHKILHRAISERADLSDLKSLDLRGITYNSDKVECKIYLRPYLHRVREWIVCGAVNIRQESNESWIGAYIKDGATDFEHDSAIAFKLPIIGLKYKHTENHDTWLEAYIEPNRASSFHVPEPNYNPADDEDSHLCDRCSGSESHLIVPEGRYLPNTNVELFNRVRGCKIDIYLSNIDAG